MKEDLLTVVLIEAHSGNPELRALASVLLEVVKHLYRSDEDAWKSFGVSLDPREPLRFQLESDDD